MEVDYRGYEVTVENFVRMMTGNAMLPVCVLVSLLVPLGGRHEPCGEHTQAGFLELSPLRIHVLSHSLL